MTELCTGGLDLDELLAVRSADRSTVAAVGLTDADLEAATHRLAAAEARFADMFADSTPDGATVLRAVWALDRSARYLLVETPVSGSTYASLSDIAPAAFVEECEMYEQFAIRPRTHKPLNRLAIPPSGRHLPRLGRAPRRDPRQVYAAHTVGGHAFEFPVGPVRGAGVESLYYGLVTSGEEVVDLYLFTSHKHRGVEWRLRGMSPEQALFQVERLEGLSAVANAWAFADAVERATGCPPTPEATRVRATALELERLYNHAGAIAALCQSTGLSVGQANAEIALERLLRVNAAVFGHRYLFGVVAVGGVARAPDTSALRRELPGAAAELHRVTRALSKTNSFLDRLEATGTVTRDEAAGLGLVGPVARASGLDIDARRDHPAPGLSAARPAVAHRSTGDVLARYQVFLAEIAESVRLLDELSSETLQPPTAQVPPIAGEGLGSAESSRGESLCWVRLDDTGRVARARLRPASVRNWRAFDNAARSQNVFTDIPIIEASFWLTVAGMAR